MEAEHLNVVFSVIAAITGYYIYFYVFSSVKVQAMFARPGPEGGIPLPLFMASKITGFLTMGLIPAVIYFLVFHESLAQVGLSVGGNLRFWYLLIGLPAVAAGSAVFTSRSPETIRQYPEVRFVQWTTARLTATCAGWFLYLLAYEFLFRGLLLFTMLYAFGPVTAVVINIALYSALHMTKGIKETLGAIPLGLILCLVALLTDSFLIPFLVHLALALSTHFFTIKYNPEMRIVSHNRGGWQ